MELGRSKGTEFSFMQRLKGCQDKQRIMTMSNKLASAGIPLGIALDMGVRNLTARRKPSISPVR